MKHQLTVGLATQNDMFWVNQVIERNHYLHKLPDPRARVMTYSIRFDGIFVGCVMLGIPHATKCQGWWGYPGLPTQWQVVDLCRIWLSPAVQFDGSRAVPGNVPGFTDRRGVFRPTVATWAINEVLQRVQADRVRLWPPVYLNQPYHILLALSYSDPQYHKGTIYRQAGAIPMYTDGQGNAVAGSSGKYGWCWKLPEPQWSWDGLDDIKPRTLRMEFA